MAGPEQNPRISLVTRLQTRDGTLNKDSYMKNFMRDGTDEGPMALKRPGLTTFAATSRAGGQAMFNFNGVPYMIQGDTITNLVTFVGALLPNVGTAGLPMSTFVNVQAGTVAIKNTERAWLFTVATNTVVQVTNANYPAATVPGLVYLDGTYYVCDTVGNVYGSALQDFTTWTALNFIQTDAGQGQPLAINRYLNYVVVLSDRGTQLFYDAAGPSPGSPLAAVTNASFLTGCVAGYSPQSNNDTLIWLSRNQTHGRSVTIFNGLQMQVVSTPAVDKILDTSTLVGLTSLCIRISGNSLYILNLPDLGFSLVYDFTFNDWYVWTSYRGGVDYVFDAVAATDTGSTTYLLSGYTSKIWSMSLNNVTDSGLAINCFIRTDEVDGRIINYKFLTAMYLIADTVGATIAMRYSNDDCQTFSAWTNIDLSSPRKMVRKLGKFRHRTFEFQFQSSTQLRLEAAELDMIGLGNY